MEKILTFKKESNFNDYPTITMHFDPEIHVDDDLKIKLINAFEKITNELKHDTKMQDIINDDGNISWDCIDFSDDFRLVNDYSKLISGEITTELEQIWLDITVDIVDLSFE